MGKRSRLLQQRRSEGPRAPQEHGRQGGRPLQAAPAARRAPRPLPPLDALKRRYWTVQAEERRTREVVLACRADGHSWATIGRAMHLTGEGARRKWGGALDDR
jgi:hypothetical protein